MFALRRSSTWLIGVLCLSLLATACGGGSGRGPAAGGGGGGSEDLKQLEIGLGYFPFGPMQRSFVHYDQQKHVIREVARELGYDLTVEWKQFPAAPEQLAAFKSGDVVIGPMATFPLIAQLKAGQRFGVLTNTLGMYRFMVMVRKDGPVKTFDDLRGARVGVAVGTAHQAAFEQFLLAEFGKPSSELGVQYVNQPVPVPTMPPGLDAYVTFIPAILPALEDPNSNIEPLLYLTPPETGPAYDGPLGPGEGHEVPSAEKSPFHPEGFTSLRNPFVVTEKFAREHPDVVQAFVMAHQRVNRELAALPPEEVTEYWPEETWKRMPRKAFEEQSLAVDLVYDRRDWVWPTKGEVDIMWTESESMVKMDVIPSPLSGDELAAAFAITAPILKEAYEALDSYPDADVFDDPEATDLRGPPVWEIDWSSYAR